MPSNIIEKPIMPQKKKDLLSELRLVRAKFKDKIAQQKYEPTVNHPMKQGSPIVGCHWPIKYSRDQNDAMFISPGILLNSSTKT